MRKLSKIFATLSLLFFVSFGNVNALTTELVSEDGLSQTYYIIATPPKESTAIQMRLTVTGGTITDVSDVDSDLYFTVPVCENEMSYMDDRVCLELAVTQGTLQPNTPVLAVTVLADSEESVVFTADADHAYLTVDAELMTEFEEILDVFETQTAVDEPVLPVEEATQNDTDSSLPFLLLLGILLVLVVAFLVIVLLSKKDKEEEQETITYTS